MTGFFNPEELIKELDLKKEMIAAEFGCGSGNIVIALAKKLTEGKVYGLDIQEEPLSYLKGRAKAERLFNVETIRCDLEEELGSTLPNNFVDLVFIPNLLFQVEKKEQVLKEAQRIAKPGGKIFIIDWKEDASFGPKERVPLNQIKEMGERLNLILEKEKEMGSFHYLVGFSKT